MEEKRPGMEDRDTRNSDFPGSRFSSAPTSLQPCVRNAEA